MRTALRIIFSRYGIVVIILLLVIGVIALTQGREDFPLSSGESEGEEQSTSDAPSQEITGDDGIATPECEGAECEEDDSPLHDPFEETDLPTEAADKALGFAEAWIDVEGKDSNSWYQGIQPYMTEGAAELMQGVDPVSVPASEIVAETEIDGGKVRIPMDTGTLVLTMIEDDNAWAEQAWLVSAIDWEPA